MFQYRTGSALDTSPAEVLSTRVEGHWCTNLPFRTPKEGHWCTNARTYYRAEGTGSGVSQSIL